MRFRLVYDGPLTTGKSHHKSENKWLIRRSLAPQLAELWKLKPALLGHAEAEFSFHHSPHGGIAIEMEMNDPLTPTERRRQKLLTPIERGGFGYLPIVRKELYLACTLDILFLRKDDPGDVISNCGDLDNRIKNLFDALRPPEMNEPRPSDIPEEPLHVLAEDDRLITSFAVRTDRLLTRPKDDPETVMLIIDVVITPYRIEAALNSAFGWE